MPATLAHFLIALGAALVPVLAVVVVVHPGAGGPSDGTGQVSAQPRVIASPSGE